MAEQGDRLGGRYRVTGVSGRGAVGVVWHAVDELIGREVAVKELRPPAADRAAAAERALREARNLGRLNHPGVLAIHDVVPPSSQDEAVYLVVELVRAPTLADLVASDGALPPNRVAALGLRVLEALTAAHDLGIVHRDVKPANVMVLTGDRIKLVDFGIALAAGDERLTRDGVVGSPGYLAPELFEGADPSPASDLWSLGVTLFHAVEGTEPFDRGTAASTIHAVLYADLPRPTCGGPLAEAVTGLLDRDPARRFTAADAVALLEKGSADDGGPAVAPRPRWEASATTVSRVEPRRRHPDRPAFPVVRPGWDLAFRWATGVGIVAYAVFVAWRLVDRVADGDVRVRLLAVGAAVLFGLAAHMRIIGLRWHSVEVSREGLTFLRAPRGHRFDVAWERVRSVDVADVAHRTRSGSAAHARLTVRMRVTEERVGWNHSGFQPVAKVGDTITATLADLRGPSADVVAELRRFAPPVVTVSGPADGIRPAPEVVDRWYLLLPRLVLMFGLLAGLTWFFTRVM
ncbi:hypothetical protein GCM10022243_67230 [Saccharothrix violaceirubra]|uniref:non-specific serine/threonine protein kinase n=1 Tax=Saccharothrix violaceirubra TaxID=413306 RepID=A0A7W7T4U2_9PSEU|nr:serine/threonine-protein kinase [Saccharothrix violaceirubra]MBB4965325.1 tRNA A-37 threonylcarbamoyl transferase component Bud32 [Saccharothrix violaceirubra]